MAIHLLLYWLNHYRWAGAEAAVLRHQAAVERLCGLLLQQLRQLLGHKDCWGRKIAEEVVGHE